ncbi:hypothetical protein [uncultured Microbulbifer sp.]|uniref:hypothetical protein n=1 Tax=uncultured Microbulbifer sp. TaxID=348147 RepID=UPI0025FE9A15|nr:hypothetical protein [uncultured Microbulbifer sp.]
MKNSKLFIALALLSLAATGCSSSGNVVSIDTPKGPYPDRKDSDWCQENYSSASVSSRERQSNAKYCDEQARRTYLEAQQKRRSEG